MQDQSSPNNAAAPEYAEVQTAAHELLDASTLDASTIIVSWLVIVACLQVMYVAFALYGSKPKLAPVLANLTPRGLVLYAPEREIPIYILGCTVTLALSLFCAHKWRRFAAQSVQRDPSFSLRACIIGVLIGGAGCICAMGWILVTGEIGEGLRLPLPITGLVMLLPALCELALTYRILRLKPTTRARRFLLHLEDDISARLVHRRDKSEGEDSSSAWEDRDVNKTWWRWVDVGAVALICFLASACCHNAPMLPFRPYLWSIRSMEAVNGEAQPAIAQPG